MLLVLQQNMLLGEAAESPPVFAGEIPNLTLIKGVPMKARDFSGYFTSADAFSIADDLPDGVSFLASGVMKGTPTEAGTFPVVVRAHNDYGSTDSNAFTIRVKPRTRRANRFAFGKFSRRIS